MLLFGSTPGVSNAGYARNLWYGHKECEAGGNLHNHLVLGAFSLVCM